MNKNKKRNFQHIDTQINNYKCNKALQIENKRAKSTFTIQECLEGGNGTFEKVAEFCGEAEQLALKTKDAFKTLENKRVLEKCLNTELCLLLAKTRSELSKNECKDILLNLALTAEKNAIEMGLKKKLLNCLKEIETLQRNSAKSKSIYEEQIRCLKFSERNLEGTLERSKKCIENYNKENKVNRNKFKELEILEKKIQNFTREIDLYKQTLKTAEEKAGNLRKIVEQMEKRDKQKTEKLISLSRFLEQCKENAAEKIKECHSHERKRVDELARLHKEETAELELSIARRDDEIKDLMNKLSATEDTIHKMGKNLLALSRNEANEGLKRKLEMSQLEILKLKSRVANLREIKDSQPVSIADALKKGFRLEKEYAHLKDKNDSLKKEVSRFKIEKESALKKIEELESKFEIFKVECEQRTGFYRNVTHSILKRFRAAFEKEGRGGKAEGLEEMFELISSCENSQLATPRLRRIVSCFSREKMEKENGGE